MNCNYRILNDVHIGVRVRKTKDKTTVPFKNHPMTGIRIKEWNQLGFKLSHPDLPKDIWVDFWQLPLDTIQLEYGVIKNPITFVEQVMAGGSMVLVRADTLDYMEMLHDKKDKDEAATYGVRDLTPGDRVISAICKDGNVAVYLGTFNIARYSWISNYGYGYRATTERFYHIDETPERAFFAYENPNGGYMVKSYPPQNKVVKENYLAVDKGKGNRVDPRFSDEAANQAMILALGLTKDRTLLQQEPDQVAQIQATYPRIEYSGDSLLCHIQKSKVDIRQNAVNQIAQVSKEQVHLTCALAREAYKSRKR